MGIPFVGLVPRGMARPSLLNLHLHSGRDWARLLMQGDKSAAKEGSISRDKLSFPGGIAMCENCTQHGEGKAWYLEALEYGEDLLADLDRQRYIQDFSPAKPALSVDGTLSIIYGWHQPLRPIIRSFI